MADITSANAVYMLGIASVFPIPVQLQGFSTEDIFSTDAIDTAEVKMGLDGRLSSGFIFVPVPQAITLQADSESNDVFDAWFAAEQAIKSKLSAFGVISLPAINKKWTLTNGVLTSYPPMPDAKKTLQPRKYGITWEKTSPAVVA